MVRIRRVSTFHRVWCVLCECGRPRVCVSCGVWRRPGRVCDPRPVQWLRRVCLHRGCAGQRAVSMAALMAIQERPGRRVQG